MILPAPVIVVEDDHLIQMRFKEILCNIGYTNEKLLFAQNLAQANRLLNDFSASFALVDLGLPDGSGIEFIKKLKCYDPSISILVLVLVLQGLSNKEIASDLNISRYTVEAHIKHIYRKLEVCTRTKAVGTARSMGLID